MTTYAFAALLCAGVALAVATLVPGVRKSAFIVAGAFFIVALALVGLDCAISCVSTGELYVPKR